MKQLVCLVATVCIIGCNPDSTNKLFHRLETGDTGIDFVNIIDPYAKPNIFDYLYYYNGGGVAAGDINNDGLDDLYFVSNQQGNKLYLNKGNLQFEDITEAAGVSGGGNWKTGVTMADVNNDGLVDIYLSAVGGYLSFEGRNQLFINKGNNTFSEQAAEYGLAIEGLNTQAVFFDYDRDGDLDCFLVNHSVHSNESLQDSSIRYKTDVAAGDKLFRNDRVHGHSFFTEVTKEAGIFSSAVGYGLNAIAGDLNNDGWDDIYVSNDFHEEDYFYLNLKNGRFQEVNKTAFAHESRFSMGSDMADVNNDGWLDIFTADMLPDDETILKESLSDDPLTIYEHKQKRWGYHPQFSRNALQINLKNGTLFSDIGLYAGVAATDWSWSPLLADFNNDGLKDLFVSNGIVKRPNNIDFLKYAAHQASQHSDETMRMHDRDKLEKMPEGKVPNKIFQALDGYRFRDQTIDWGFDHAGISTGACYADLDNDGDLEIIVNNTNEQAAVYENRSSGSTNNALQIRLKGDSLNPLGYGAKVRVDAGSHHYYTQLTASRGFQSASTSRLHIGLGNGHRIHRILVDWPNGKFEIFEGPFDDRMLTISFGKGKWMTEPAWPGVMASEKMLTESSESRINFDHKEDGFSDFTVQELIPQKLSTEGPALAIADVNGDGLHDVYIGGAKGQAGKIFLQSKSGTFLEGNNHVFIEHGQCEDVDAVFFDADNDKDLDLFVVSGGNEYFETAVTMYDRLYLNDGKGNFQSTRQHPGKAANKSTVAVADIDRDGDLDLFIGGRSIVGRYGQPALSYLLINDGKGKFSEPSDSFLHTTDSLGMVSDAVFTDLNKDNWPDLVVVGDWMPVTVFLNRNGKLLASALTGLEFTAGLWKTVCAEDINGDGYPDLLAGNLGTNTKLTATADHPLVLFHGPLSNQHSYEQILSVYREGQLVSFHGKEELEKRLPHLLRKKYPTYAAYANQSIQQVLGDKLNQMNRLEVVELRSMSFTNQKGSGFLAKALPPQIQWSSVHTIYSSDLNSDKKPDFLCGGNFSGVTPYEGHYDAGYGWVLIGDGLGGLELRQPEESGWVCKGELRKIEGGKLASGSPFFVIARNNQSIQIIETNKK